MVFRNIFNNYSSFLAVFNTELSKYLSLPYSQKEKSIPSVVATEGFRQNCYQFTGWGPFVLPGKESWVGKKKFL
jgi:hypothetical protein